MLTPEDIENRDFLVSLRGYDRAEVRAFLADVAEQVRDLQDVQDEWDDTSGSADDEDATSGHEPAEADAADPEPPRERPFAQIAEETQRILEAAREAADDMLRNARVDADRQLQSARQQAARLIAEGERRREDIEEVVAGLEAARASLSDNLLEAQRTIEHIVSELGTPAPAATTVREALTAEAAAPQHEDATAQQAVTEPAGDDVEPVIAEPSDEDLGPREEDIEPVGAQAAEAPTSAVSPDPEPAAPSTLRDDSDASDPQALRAVALTPLHPQVVRSVKRGLQDVQNVALDRLRRSAGEGEPESLLPGDEEVGRLGDSAADSLAAAYRAGVDTATRLAGRPLPAPAASRDLVSALCTDAAERVRSPLAATLRMGRSADEGLPAMSDRVSAVFSELKATVAEELAATHLTRAYELGLLDAWAAGGITHRRWVLGREPRCPEARCRYNDQTSVVALGEAYPSGHETPPVHVGCTCTTVPVLEPPS